MKTREELRTATISDLVKLYDKEVEKIVKIRKDNSHISLSAKNESDSSDANQNQKSKKIAEHESSVMGPTYMI